MFMVLRSFIWLIIFIRIRVFPKNVTLTNPNTDLDPRRPGEAHLWNTFLVKVEKWHSSFYWQIWNVDNCFIPSTPSWNSDLKMNNYPEIRKDWKGDGFCDCFMNNTNCNFDDGDCENGMGSWKGKSDIIESLRHHCIGAIV